MIQAVDRIISFTDFFRTSSFRELQSVALVEQLEQRINVFVLERVLLVGAWLD